MNRVSKRQLRERNKATRLGLTPEVHRRNCQSIVDHLLAWQGLQAAKCVASFWPMLARREVDLRSLHAALSQQEKVIAYPFMTRTDAGFRECSDTTQLIDNPWGFSEPGPPCRLVAPGELSLIIVPALALTVSGKRLGYGAGFYDRLLPMFRPPAVVLGCCYASELVADLPTEPHDQAVDWVVTEQGIEPCSPSSGVA